jgi:hypothetical protein
VDFSKARDLFGIIFEIPGAFMKICGLRVDIQEVQGGGALGCTVDRGRREHRAWRHLAGARHTGARARRSSPAGCNRERGETGNSMGCSLGCGRQHGSR